MEPSTGVSPGPEGGAPENQPSTKPGTHPKFLIGGAVVAAALIGLVGWAMSRSGATAYFLETSELAANGPTGSSEQVRVNGNVVPGTVERDGLTTTFVISDGATEVTVATDHPLPDSFRDRADTEIVALGSFDGTQFSASEVLAKCPSKFKARDEA